MDEKTNLLMYDNAWELREQGILSVREHDLYCFLLHRCNKVRWQTPFILPTMVICAILGISRNKLLNHRQKLQQLGLIEFKEGCAGRGKPAEYSLCIPDNVSVNVSDNVSVGIHNVSDNIKIKKNFDLSFVESEFKQPFMEWLQYKREKRQEYKGQQSLMTCYKHLKKISDNNPEIAKVVIEWSIAKNYTGFFRPSDKEIQMLTEKPEKGGWAEKIKNTLNT
jgi:hypothetical protein